MDNFFKFATAVIVAELVGVIGSYFTIPAVSGWYAGLVKPALSPPDWVFAPTWTALYLAMGVSAYLVWSADLAEDTLKRRALAVFGLQLALNLLWTLIFFGLQNILAALVEIVILWALILWTIIRFYKISRTASYLLLPYIIWVSFAAYLNLSLWILN